MREDETEGLRLQRRALVLSPLAGWLTSLQAANASSLRVALVIGNAAYANAPLPNAANDARAMGAALEGMGFTVVQVRDGTRSQMADALARASALLQGRSGIGLLYYAGHGLQLDWRNFLLPVDAVLTQAADVPRQALDTQSVIEAFKSAGTRVNILVLDACRDNPFGQLASARGLAPMDAPPGTYMAYATAPGNYAEDGSAADGNGLYTGFLVKEIQQPDAKIEDVFKRVRTQVRQASKGRQVPWDSSSLEDDFVFATGQQVAERSRRQREAAFAAQKTEWDRVKDSTRPEDLYAFLQRHPTGGMAELATARLERLERTKVTTQPNQQGEVQNPVATRFRLGDRYELALRDGLTGLERRRLHIEVTRVTEDRAEFLGLRLDGTLASNTLAGAVITDGGGSYDPPYILIPGGEFQVGKRWEGRSLRVTNDGRSGWMEYSGRIVARERITVPAGSFDTYRLEKRVLFENGETQKRVLWMQPEWGMPLRLTVEIRAPGSGVELVLRELVSRHRKA
jgi:uncharacterized caspase-like protein